MKHKKDWWCQMTLEEQQEIKIGLVQADKCDYKEYEQVMKRFNKLKLW